MGDSRSAESGIVAPSRDVTITIPVIGADAEADVVLTADSVWAGGPALAVCPLEALPAHVFAVGAWVSNTTTGAVTVRFHADHTGYAGGDVDFRIAQQL